MEREDKDCVYSFPSLILDSSGLFLSLEKALGMRFEMSSLIKTKCFLSPTKENISLKITVSCSKTTFYGGEAAHSAESVANLSTAPAWRMVWGRPAPPAGAVAGSMLVEPDQPHRAHMPTAIKRKQSEFVCDRIGSK